MCERHVRGGRHLARDDGSNALHGRVDLSVDLRAFGVELREARAEFLQFIAVIDDVLHGIAHDRDRIISMLLMLLTATFEHTKVLIALITCWFEIVTIWLCISETLLCPPDIGKEYIAFGRARSTIHRVASIYLART